MPNASVSSVGIGIGAGAGAAVTRRPHGLNTSDVLHNSGMGALNPLINPLTQLAPLPTFGSVVENSGGAGGNMVLGIPLSSPLQSNVASSNSNSNSNNHNGYFGVPLQPLGMSIDPILSTRKTPRMNMIMPLGLSGVSDTPSLSLGLSGLSLNNNSGGGTQNGKNNIMLINRPPGLWETNNNNSNNYNYNTNNNSNNNNNFGTSGNNANNNIRNKAAVAAGFQSTSGGPLDFSPRLFPISNIAGNNINNPNVCNLPQLNYASSEAGYKALAAQATAGYHHQHGNNNGSIGVVSQMHPHMSVSQHLPNNGGNSNLMYHQHHMHHNQQLNNNSSFMGRR